MRRQIMLASLAGPLLSSSVPVTGQVSRMNLRTEQAGLVALEQGVHSALRDFRLETLGDYTISVRTLRPEVRVSLSGPSGAVVTPEAAALAGGPSTCDFQRTRASLRSSRPRHRVQALLSIDSAARKVRPECGQFVWIGSALTKAHLLPSCWSTRPAPPGSAPGG